MNASTATYFIRLEVGDHSGDGHEQTRSYVYLSNLEPSELQAAYYAATEILGFNFSDVTAVEYEEDTISRSYGDALVDLGLLALDTDDMAERRRAAVTDGCYELTPDEYAATYVNICRYGSRGRLIISAVTSEDIEIGGYGLFS